MMSDGRGRLRAIAASQQSAAFLELFQLQAGEGPCIECYTSGAPVIAVPIQAHRERWPELVPAVQRVGYGAIATVPLRLHEDVIGAVSLFYIQPEPAVEDDLHLAQALADVAAMAMLRWPAPQNRPEDILVRLQATLTSKVTIEQAKGVLAQHGGIPVAEAGQILRFHARTQQMRMSDIARALVRRTLPPGAVIDHPPHAASHDTRNSR
jgi:hypothetical protein